MKIIIILHSKVNLSSPSPLYKSQLISGCQTHSALGMQAVEGDCSPISELLSLVAEANRKIEGCFCLAH